LEAFIHSGYFYSASSRSLLLRHAPDYSIDIASELTYRVNIPMRYRQLQLKDLS